jgi:uroporphyrinogen-III decarboxylase
MNHRERMLTALEGGKPDRLPATIHGWMDYWNNKYMNGADQFEIYRHFDMDAQIFYFAWLDEPIQSAMYFTGDLVPGPNWRVSCEIPKQDVISTIYKFTIETPEGVLTKTMEKNDKMAWVIEYPIKEKEQIQWIKKYMPLPRPDIKSINAAFEQMGDMGILRAGIFNHQGGCWQDACNYYGSQKLIMETYDDPAWVHEFLGIILDYKLKFIESLEGARIDMLENGGGDGSMSVISPAIFEEYGVPYDTQTTDALRQIGIKTAYHTCGKMMAQLEQVKRIGCDASETLTPPDMGGDADLRKIKQTLGDTMCLIGGFDQQKGFENGNPEAIRKLIEKCWEEAGPDGGYIMAASDHFFEGSPENIQTYVEIAKEFCY